MYRLRAILVFSCLVLVAGTGALGQSPTPFQVPPGWEGVRSGDSFILKPRGVLVEQAAMIVFPEDSSAGADLGAWMRRGIDALQAGLTVLTESEGRPDTAGGYETRMKVVLVSDAVGNTCWRLYLARGTGTRAQGAMYMAPTQELFKKYTSGVDWFVEHWDFAGLGKVAGPSATPSPARAPAKTPTDFFQGQIAVLRNTQAAIGFREQGRFKEALEKYRENVRITQGLLEDLRNQPESLRKMVEPNLRGQFASARAWVQQCLVRVGQFEEGLAMGKEIMATLDEKAFPLAAGRAHVALAEAYIGLLQYEHALREYEKARLDIDRFVSEAGERVRAWKGLKSLTDDQAQEVRDFYQALLDVRGIYSGIVRALDRMGRHEDVLALIESEAYKETKALLADASVLALVEMALRKIAMGSEDMVQLLMKNYRELHGRQEFEEATSLAVMCRSRGDESQDMSWYQRALDVMDQARKFMPEEPVYQAVMPATRAISLEKLGRFPEARQELAKALEFARRVDDPSLRPLLHYNIQTALAVLCLEATPRDLPRAEAALSAAAEALKGVTDADAPIRLYDLRGRLLEAQGRFGEAVEAYREAIRLVEKERAGVSTLAFKQTFFRNRYRYYERYIRALHRMKRDAEALQAMEQLRARTLLDTLAALDIPARLSPALAAQVKQQEDQEKARLIAGNRAQAAQGPADTTLRGGDAVALIEARTRTFAEVLRANPEYGSIRGAAPVPITDIQALLDPRTVVLEYIAGPEIKAVVVLKASGQPRMVELKVDTSVLQADLDGLRNALRDPRKDGWRKVAERLYVSLVAPVQDDLKGMSRVVVVPYGSLNYIPFAVLGPPGSDRLLVDDYDIVSLPSASVLKFCRQKFGSTATRASLFALGNVSSQGMIALPGTREEVTTIAGLMKDATVVMEKAFTTKAVAEKVGGSRYVHFATHGVLDHEHPEESAIVTADGRLRVGDIFRLKMAARLVVLSACETGRGKLFNGDEMVGLTRAFMYAGTPSVLATLWSVADESTAKLMTTYYQGLQQGLDKAAALRRAQLELRKNKDFEAPFFWAPFVLQGDWQ